MQKLSTAIIITAYNRPEPLKNLLMSLDKVQINGLEQVDLIISIDNGGTKDVNDIAKSFKWYYGEKQVIIHEDKLGLKNHFIWVGDQTCKYDSIIFLEDDLLVSPYLYHYYIQLLEKYYGDPNIAGLSLYSPSLCEFDRRKFYPIQDGNSVYFLQHPYWGTVWFRDAWLEFRKWLKYDYNYRPELLPQPVVKWKDTSFKKTYIQFLIERKKTFVYPRVSLVTNAGFSGEHNKRGMNEYQVELLLNKAQMILPDLTQSKSVYDAFFEIESSIVGDTLKLDSRDLTVNIRGLKMSNSKYELIRGEEKEYVFSFTDQMKPLESAVLLGINGKGLYVIDRSITGGIKNNYYKMVAEGITSEYGEIEAKTLLYLIVKKINYILSRKK